MIFIKFFEIFLFLIWFWKIDIFSWFSRLVFPSPHVAVACTRLSSKLVNTSKRWWAPYTQISWLCWPGRATGWRWRGGATWWSWWWRGGGNLKLNFIPLLAKKGKKTDFIVFCILSFKPYRRSSELYQRLVNHFYTLKLPVLLLQNSGEACAILTLLLNTRNFSSQLSSRK